MPVAESIKARFQKLGSKGEIVESRLPIDQQEVMSTEEANYLKDQAILGVALLENLWKQNTK
jgi:hypothetical protein